MSSDKDLEAAREWYARIDPFAGEMPSTSEPIVASLAVLLARVRDAERERIIDGIKAEAVESIRKRDRAFARGADMASSIHALNADVIDALIANIRASSSPEALPHPSRPGHLREKWSEASAPASAAAMCDTYKRTGACYCSTGVPGTCAAEATSGASGGGDASNAGTVHGNKRSDDGTDHVSGGTEHPAPTRQRVSASNLRDLENFTPHVEHGDPGWITIRKRWLTDVIADLRDERTAHAATQKRAEAAEQQFAALREQVAQMRAALRGEATT